MHGSQRYICSSVRPYSLGRHSRYLCPGNAAASCLAQLQSIASSFFSAPKLLERNFVH